MRLAFACVLLAATAAAAQPSSPAPSSLCGECGVVRSVRSITKEIRPSQAQEETKPSGLVASIPFKGKAEVGSSTHVGKEAPATLQTWEVVVRLDDGRFRVVVLDAQPDLGQGDKVRFDDGKLVRRGR